jgi:selenide, water dikinase
LVLADAQTSGGMLIAVPESRAEALRGALEARGVEGFEIGTVQEGPSGHIRMEGHLTE